MSLSNWLKGLSFRTVKIDGVEQVSMPGLDLIAGTGVTLTPQESAPSGDLKITINAEGGGSSDAASTSFDDSGLTHATGANVQAALVATDAELVSLDGRLDSAESELVSVDGRLDDLEGTPIFSLEELSVGALVEDGTFVNVAEYPDLSTGVGSGMTATFTILSGAVTDVEITNFGTGYEAGDVLVFRPYGGPEVTQENVTFTLVATSLADRVGNLEESTHVYADVAALRAAITIPVDGKVYRTAGQDSAGDGGHGEWIGVTGAASTYTHDGMTTIVPSGGDGSLALVRISGAVRFDLADDEASAAFRSPKLGGIYTFSSETNGNVVTMRTYHLVTTAASQSIFNHPSGIPGVDSTGSVPNGTTGPDNRVTLFITNSRTMYMENRSGATIELLLNLFI